MTSGQNTARRNMAQKVVIAVCWLRLKLSGGRGVESRLGYVWHPPRNDRHLFFDNSSTDCYGWSAPSILFFYNSTILLPSRGFAHPLISSRCQSQEYLIFSDAKTFNQKQYFLLQKCTKTHLYSNVEFQNFPEKTPQLEGEGSGNRGEVEPWALMGWTPLQLIV